jgi:hypothetical protein
VRPGLATRLHIPLQAGERWNGEVGQSLALLYRKSSFRRASCSRVWRAGLHFLARAGNHLVMLVLIFMANRLESAMPATAPAQLPSQGQSIRIPLAGTVNLNALALNEVPPFATAQGPAIGTTPPANGGTIGPRTAAPQGGPRSSPLGSLQGGNGTDFNPYLRTNFSGILDNPAIAAIPPDTQGAVGPEHLMSTLNSEVAVMTRQGQMLSRITLSNFWHTLNHPFTFDPKVVYDQLANRWVFVTLADPRTTNSALLVAASRSADPTQDWYLYSLSANPPRGTGDTNKPPQPKVWLDYPNLGYNQQWFVATVNTTSLSSTNEEDEGSSTATIFAFDKQSLYSGRGAACTIFQDPQFTVVPAVCFDNNPTNFYLVTEAATFQEGIVSQLRVSRIQGAVGRESYLQKVALTPPQPAWSFSPGPTNFAAQLGTVVKIFCNDSRLQSCVLRDGTLWCAHHIFLPAGPETNVTHCAVQWWQLTTNAAILQRGRIEDPGSKTNYTFPSLAVNQSNAVLIGYTRIASDQYASAAFAYRLANDPTNTLRPETTLKSGLAPYRKTSPGDTEVRWGDFSSTVVDPLNDIDMWTPGGVAWPSSHKCRQHSSSNL